MENFTGFNEKTVAFFEQLKENNNKEWFDANRHIYDDDVLEPSRRFVNDFGNMLNPVFNAIPKVNKSLFRIFRDTRFSKNKDPFKEHLGIYFWQGSGPRMEQSGFYIHLEGRRLTFYMGVYCFTKTQLDRYRKAIMNEELVYQLEEAIETVQKIGYNVGGKHYKKTPRGYDANHTHAEFLLYNSIYSEITMPIPEEFYSEKFIDFAYKHYDAMLPIHNWLMTAVMS
jgi:uncharacterized protein (TIGR02453 family)